MELGDLRLQEADSAGDAIVAGDEGLSLYLLIADRRGVVGSGQGSSDAKAWADAVQEVVAALERDLATSGRPL
jgi:hypothetical protein